MKKIAIVGVGIAPARAVTPEASYKELVYDAATRAYADASIEAQEIDSFITTLEDINEGTSIVDEYTPDQLGAMLKPMCTVGGDGIHGIADAVLRINAGVSNTVVVASHSKASNILTPHHIIDYALDPVFNRPLGVNPHYVAGLEMARFLHETGNTESDCAAVAAKNKSNAIRNANGAHAAKTTSQDVFESATISKPLKELEASPSSDGAAVLVLAAEDKVKLLRRAKPVWILGVGWCNDSGTLESRPWGDAVYARRAADMAYKQAGVRNPARDIDVFEIDDTFAYKELQHLEAIGVFAKGKSGAATQSGETSFEGRTPVNPSGGSLGCGHLLDCTGLFRAAEIVMQLRGEAGRHQLRRRAVRGLALSWRGIPTTSGAAVVLGS